MKFPRARFTTRRMVVGVAGLAILLAMVRQILPDRVYAYSSAKPRAFQLGAYTRSKQGCFSAWHVCLESNAIEFTRVMETPTPDPMKIDHTSYQRRVNFR